MLHTDVDIFVISSVIMISKNIQHVLNTSYTSNLLLEVNVWDFNTRFMPTCHDIYFY
jgi:hypothetical protein